jgi:glyoxylase-like metal-dependent hydrolase (beta-lactamase superfamily II)
MSGHVVPLRGSTGPWASGPVTGSAYCVLAPNPSPWTLDGTNTWLLSAPNCEQAAIVDPGPDDAGHRAAIGAAAEEAGVEVAIVLLTHGHVDHAEGARPLAEVLSVPVRALDPAHRLGEHGLADGDVVDMGEWRIDVVETPGHSGDSVCFSVPHDGSILTGDTVLGRGTSLVAWPDGRLGDYLDSLRRLRDASLAARASRLLPGHGPVLDHPEAVIDAYLDHRRARLAEVQEVIASGVVGAPAIVEVVYADVPREVWPAAELTVRAQLAYLGIDVVE